MAPFRDSPYPTLLRSDPRMEAALAAANAEALVRFPALAATGGVPISLAAIDESTTPPDFLHGGLMFAQTHYSASLLKVAAMYAAFELRKIVNVHADDAKVTRPQDLVPQLTADFDPVIDAAVPALSNAPGVTRAMRVPKYRDIFATIPLTTGGVAAEFTGAFQANMRAMIVDSSNNAAGAVIQALGYSWINGTLERGGFFFPPSQDGIWLAGTFTEAFPRVRIPSVNDGPVAQATSCFDMANLFANVVAHSLVDEDSSSRMGKLLADAATIGPDASFIDHFRRSEIDTRSYAVTHNKVGLGPLKTGGMVASEGTVVVHGPTDRRFLTVWQNCPMNPNATNGMSFIVDRAIELFLAIP